MRTITIAVLVLALASATNWAVLVAGSDGFWNYRHQADVAHAYQILRNGGIKQENIIVMMADDVASDEENPFPGQLYNHPGDDVPNVYEGLVVDYKGNDNTPANFIKVLLGDESTGKKVLKSTEEDNVFLFFSDHGGSDVLCWPEKDLTKNEFQDTLKQMFERKMFKKFVLYIEACYSGSMGLGFPEEMNISIVTAANESESSWGWYCGDDAVVKGKNLGTCLGDEFSVFWMEDTDKGEQATETLEVQFNRIKAGVTKSHASRYGDKSFSADLIGDFVGYPATAKKFTRAESVESWDSRDNKFLYLRYKYLTSTGEKQKKFEKLYHEELSLRQQMDRYFNSIANKDSYYDAVTGPVENTKCYLNGIAQMEAIFGRNDYQFKYYNVLANLCKEDATIFSKY